MLGETSHPGENFSLHEFLFIFEANYCSATLPNCELCQTISYYGKQEACESYIFKIMRVSSYYELKAFKVIPWCNGYVDLQEERFIPWRGVCAMLFNTQSHEAASVHVRFQLIVQNAVSAQPCVGKLGISHVLLNFLGCNFRW